MSLADHRLHQVDYDLEAFDCGAPFYNAWLTEHAASSVQAGVCAVYLLVEESEVGERVVGYYAINPSQVVRSAAPDRMARGWPETVPAWRMGKLAVHVELRADAEAQWGRQLLRDALETIVGIADIGGGKVIMVDADNPGLVESYVRNGFRTTGARDDRSLWDRRGEQQAAAGGQGAGARRSRTAETEVSPGVEERPESIEHEGCL